MIVGTFVGEILGVGDVLVGWVKTFSGVGISGVLVGRAWVSSLPNFFLGKHSHFWKLPPYFCINSRDNVYYPIFLTCYLVIKTNIEYAVLCIISECLSAKMLS